ncbi:hypothetical protein WN51_00850 [Melipona quadrifasciata]|uniref:Uncharacterized protein n=1 Tax=Melipona quadrifasciata TaxID=166423 RepID=A0A0N0U7Q2_9HYME|nr:hypothetical protein WN51_00850 [Melipona quadrifasciata]
MTFSSPSVSQWPPYILSTYLKKETGKLITQPNVYLNRLLTLKAIFSMERTREQPSDTRFNAFENNPTK